MLRLGLCAFLASVAFAHDPRLELPEPKSVPEAWNVIVESSDNVGKLIETRQLKEIAFQVANCSPALRMLESHAAEAPEPDQLGAQIKQAFQTGIAVILASREATEAPTKTRACYDAWRSCLGAVQEHYASPVIHSAIYVCPMHPLGTHLDPSDKCAFCGMPLIRRHIPASAVYDKPGEASTKLAVSISRPLEAGRPAQVIIHLTRADGSPVRIEDLVVTHTQPMHLLIVDTTLADYHHEHPKPTGTPGEYVFTFTPRVSGPYRIFADLLPGWTGMQEYAIADLAADASGGPVAKSETTSTTTLDGLRFQLEFETHGKPLRVADPVVGRLTVTSADGKPFTKLEPVMGAFAHFVGFGADRRTVVHIHPTGPDPSPALSYGGPSLQFQFYPPAAGYFRLYAQVAIGGESKFAPFALNVLPAQAEPGTREAGATADALASDRQQAERKGNRVR